MAPAEPATPLSEPKKRGRPRKNTLAPTVHKRSNSTDSKPATRKQSKKDDPVPTIPQPPAVTKSTATKGRDTDKKRPKEEINVPTAADNFRAQEPSPEATGESSPISTLNPEDLGTRVQAVSSKAASEAQKFADKAVEALDSTGKGGLENVRELLQDTLKQASNATSGSAEDGQKDQKSRKDETDGGEIPQSEKTALLSMFGLTGLWVVFGGKFQKKAGPKK
ncbi:protein of unknown function [Taphrina deformans PYCC 5710]|uniref:Uncharacterized protein n=1 Tax=Taphrina deformans (strain PYCC 5710 / ATCC 11124 / CBS 356.35 / IMI 108563 / JCM 9778 / NBRC 8474) TaxID=1097556 RepID=R4XGZ3_TAPDE|nr:protein of unknown function [Taphrina deformans PYCC 5710]|eukprot:CCG82631.1 protein of unknown function [Taphrina deformans PYCC 5710]